MQLLGWLFGNAAAHIKARKAKKRGDMPEQMPVEEVQNTGFAALATRKILHVGGKGLCSVICAVAVALFTLVFGSCSLAIFIYHNYPQIAVAETIEERAGDDAVLLTYKIGDMGFYNALDQAPQFKYFALNDFSRESFPEMYDEMERYAREGLADYIVTEYGTYIEDMSIFEEGGYTIVGEYSYVRIKDNFTWHNKHYVLLERQG